MKPSSPNTGLRAALSLRAGLVAEIANLSALASDTSQRRSSLQMECDLTDGKALAEISRLQTIEALVPFRMAAKERLLSDATGQVLSESHRFVTEHLGPMARQIEGRVVENVERSLRPLITDAVESDRAVGVSSPVQKVRALTASVKLQHDASCTPETIIAYADKLLSAYDALLGLSIS